MTSTKVPTARRVRATAIRRQARRGAAAVEFAIVAPIFLFSVIMPLIEFGRGMAATNSLAATSEVGCRAGVLPGGTNTTVTTAINNSLTAQGISSGSATVTIKVNGATADVSTAAQGDSISVTVAVPYSSISWLPSGLSKFLGNVTLSSTQLMRRE